MTKPLWLRRAKTEARQRPLLVGCLIPAAGGVVVGVLLAFTALVILGPQPQAPTSATTSVVPAHATITLDDAFLSQLDAEALTGAALPFAISSVRVAIHPANQIAIYADATAGLFTRQLTVTGTLTAVDGRLRLSVTQASVGGLALPAALDAALESALNARLAALNDLFQFGGTSYAITSVTTQEGKLTLGLAPS